MNDNLGQMGTATADSLREVGLEPEAPPARAVLRPRETAPALHPGLSVAIAEKLLDRLLFALGAVAVASFLSFCCYSVARRAVADETGRTYREVERAMQRQQELAEARARVADLRERELEAAVRWDELQQARLVRAERRARRLAQGRRP